MTRRVPSPEVALRLLHERFLNRTDMVSVWAPWNAPCPISPVGTLDELLLGHLFGDAVPATKVSFRTRHGPGAMRGRFRVGSYTPGPDDTTRWLCIDFDGGAEHTYSLEDPRGAALAAVAAFEAVGLSPYLESSGSATGWHVWCFFDPPLPAPQARAVGHALVPRDQPLAGNPASFADPRLGRGIGVFPKQDKLRRKGRPGVGTAVWLPWWQGAQEGGGTFFQRGPGDAWEPYVPDDFTTAAPEAIERILAALPTPRRPRSLLHPHGSTPPGPGSTRRHDAPAERPGQAASSDKAAWAEWRGRALAALPLEGIYGAWLTGRVSGVGWLECRDPASSSGDQQPSAGVADGTGEAERGSFHSFISGATVSVFDFLVAHGGAVDLRAARRRVAELAGVPEPLVGAAAWTSSPPGSPSQSTNLAASSEPTPLPPDQPPSSGTPRWPVRRPIIYLRTDEYAVVDETIAALSRVEGVYQRGPVLVHIVNHDGPLSGVIHPPGSLVIFPLGGAGVRNRITLAAELVEVHQTSDGLEERAVHPPAWLAPAVEARKQWPGVPHLEGIVNSPVLRPDGTLLERPGYDPDTGLFFAPNAQFPAMPANPTQQQAVAAAAELLDVVVDFPFKSDAHRAAWLAGVLTPLARFAFRGPSPLFAIDANVRSAGKGLLADVIGEIVAGREMARTPQAPDETEEIKRITSIALAGTRLVLLDNINRALGSGALDAVLTATVWSERILGKSETVHLPLLAVWYATGNNLTFQGDTARRCLQIRLDSDLEKPELREGFQHPSLRSWTHNERPHLVAAALTLLRAYCLAGRPAMPVKPWGSFEGWSELVRNAIVWVGLPDPCETRAEIDEVDSDARAVVDLIAGWLELPNQWGTIGCTVARALEVLHDDLTGRRCPRLRAALGELCPHPHGQLPTARKVGSALRRFRGRVIDGRKIQTRVLDGNNLWFVQCVGEAATQAVHPKSTAQLSLVDGSGQSQESDR